MFPLRSLLFPPQLTRKEPPTGETKFSWSMQDLNQHFAHNQAWLISILSIVEIIDYHNH